MNLSSTDSSSYSTWTVGYSGFLSNFGFVDDYVESGIRPVITVSKSNIK